MDERIERIEKFLSVSTELIEGKFINADTKISEVLAAIAGSRDLTELFSAVTQGFDFSAAKRNYLRFPAAEGAAHGVAYLPADRSETLAFIFCLFVEIDAGALPFNDFLLRYFYVDGSYTASFSVFTERLVKPFRDIVRDCYPDVGRRGKFEKERREQEELVGAIARIIPAEKARLNGFALREEEKTAVDVLLSEAAAAAARREISALVALLAGYKYLLRYVGGEDKNSAELFRLAARL